MRVINSIRIHRDNTARLYTPTTVFHRIPSERPTKSLLLDYFSPFYGEGPATSGRSEAVFFLLLQQVDHTPMGLKRTPFGCFLAACRACAACIINEVQELGGLS